MAKIYAVKKGRSTGIFSDWSECEKQVRGYPGALYKSFPEISAALRYLAEETVPPAKAAQGAPAVVGKNAPSSPCERGRGRSRASSASQSAKPSAPVDTANAPEHCTDFVLYTDGSCLKNPNGPGGWAALLYTVNTGERTEHSGGAPSTTNNRMELTAAVEALTLTPPGSSVLLHTDSQYLRHAFAKHWVANWKRNGWVTAKKTPVLNRDLWQKLDELTSKRRVIFRWVRGHAGQAENERCDALARAEAHKYT